MTKRVALLTILTLLAGRGAAYAAAKNEEVLQLPSLLMFDGVAQVVTAEYLYRGHKENNSSSSSSTVREHYGFSTALSVMDPHLANLLVNAGISYTQHFGQTQGDLHSYDYKVSTNILDQSYHPVTINASHGTTVVSNGYTPSYTLINDSYQLHAALLHSTVPVDLYLSRNKTQSEGLDSDTSQSDGSELLTMRHDVPYSHTFGTISHNSSNVRGDDVNGYAVSATNSLSFDPLNNYQLGSSVSFSQSKGLSTQDKNYSFQENLVCRFGKALSGGASYRHEYRSTLNYEGEPQPTTKNTVAASLRHTLFQSLSTDLSAQASRSTLLGGDEEFFGSAFNVLYTKRLPAESRVDVILGIKEDVTRQNLLASSLTVRDERHVVAAQGEEIVPAVTGQLTAVFSVRSVTPISIDYIEGTDYSVDLNRGVITVLFGGRIDSGTPLLISYIVDYNPSIKYVTNGKNASAQYIMLNGRYTLTANISSQSQKLISGQATSQRLNDSTTASLSADAAYTKVRFGAQFSNYDSTSQSFSRLAGYWRYSTVLEDGTSLSLNLSDVYSIYPADETSEGYSTNSATVSGSYARVFFDFLRFNTSLAATDVRSDNGSSDFLAWSGGLSGNYNQLTFALNGSTKYRFSGNSTKVDNSLQCTISRVF